MILHTKKKFLRRAFLSVAAIGAVVFAISNFINQSDEQTIAMSGNGDEVELIFDANAKIFYGEHRTEMGNRGATHWFTTNTENNGSYTAYCSQPTKKPLAGTFRVEQLNDNDSEVPAADRTKYKMMKLMIFAATNGGPGAAADANMQAAATNLMNYLFDSSTMSGLNITASDTNLIYAYTHAVLGLIYDVDYDGSVATHELGSHEAYVRGIITKLANIVNGSVTAHNTAYIMSQSYNLYTVDRYNPVSIDISGYEPSEYQDIVWIESPELGKIQIQKKDYDKTTAQGNASLAGITFQVKNISGKAIYDPKDKRIYDDGATIRTGVTGADGKITFEVPIGKYEVRETRSNTFYKMTDVDARTAEIISYRSEDVGLPFANKINNTGKVTVYKYDQDNGGCSPAGKASLAGSQFSLYNESSQPIYYNGNEIPVHGLIDTKTVATGECSVTFSNLPAGEYRVKEILAGTGYNRDPIDKTVYVTVANDAIVSGSTTVYNQVKRGNVKFKKIDVNDNNAAMANVAFKITSKTTGENHIVVTDSDGEVDTSKIAHNSYTNWYERDNTIAEVGAVKNYVYHNNYGTWFWGNETGTGNVNDINNALGALPYDDYTLTELACLTNEFCYDIENLSIDFSVRDDSTVSVTLPGSPFENDCVHHEIATTASDPVDGDKYILVGEEVTVRDRVAYHAMRGKSYTVRGTLYDAETGLPLNSTQSKSFSIPENGSEDGYVDLDFTFNSTEYAGHSIVVFEELVYDGRVVAEHKELTDEKQTVYVIDFGTTAVDDADGDKYIANEENMTIEDTIDYCLVAHQSFRFVAHLYDKTTGRLLVNSNGDVIEYSLDVTPETACGAAVIELGFNAKGLEGHHIVVFEKLYHEDDLIMTHEDKEDEDQTVYVIGFGTTAVDQEDRDKYVIDGDLVTIRDRIRYCLVADRTFTVSAYLVDKATGQPIEGGEGEIVSRTYTFVPNTDCGSFVATFKVNASKLAGHDLVAFERVLDDGKVVLTHEDIEDQNETVRVISLQTFATSNQDEIDELDEDSEIVITDLVKYCLKANNEFTFVGKLYDKDSGQQLVIDGTPVEQSYTFTPKKDCGEFELTYKFPAKGMAKKEFVILEELYDDFGRRILLREDLDNEDETVRLPDTGYMIKADGGVDGGSNPAVIALLGILVTAAFVIVRGFTKTIIGTRKAF